MRLHKIGNHFFMWNYIRLLINWIVLSKLIELLWSLAILGLIIALLLKTSQVCVYKCWFWSRNYLVVTMMTLYTFVDVLILLQATKIMLYIIHHRSHFWIRGYWLSLEIRVYIITFSMTWKLLYRILWLVNWLLN